MLMGCAASPVDNATLGDVAAPETQTPPEILGDYFRPPNTNMEADSGIDPDEFLEWIILSKENLGEYNGYYYAVFRIANPNKNSLVREVEVLIIAKSYGSYMMGYTWTINKTEYIYVWDCKTGQFSSVD